MKDKIDTFAVNCEKTLEHFKSELGKIRGARASGGMLENIQVDYYGTKVPLIQMGLINTPEPRLITVQVYDASAVDSVEKAIRTSDLGLNPAREGNLIRLNVPSLTEDRRKELIKKLGKLGEDEKVVVRNHRKDCIDALKKMEKDKEITEDELKKGQADVQVVTDKYVAKIDELFKQKEAEILEV